MRIVTKEKEPLFCENTLVDYYTIYKVDKLPNQREYIDLGDKKGYVVSLDYDEELKSYTTYLEEHLDDWNNQICEVCDVVYLRGKEN